jgi:hypothetical protein
VKVISHFNKTLVATFLVTSIARISLPGESLPPGTTQAYAEAALLIIRQQLYLPAYRNGKPVDSTTHPKIYFIPAFNSLR